MSLDSRLRTDLREIAATVDPAAQTALRAVFARRDRRAYVRHLVPRTVAAAACLLLVGVLLAWWVTGRDAEPDVVVDPNPPVGTYEATLRGDLAGDWRLRFEGDTISVLAPDSGLLGTRVSSASYDIRHGELTTSLLADGPCTGPGAYSWTADVAGLIFTAEEDDCDLRVRLLTSSAWSPVSGTPLSEGTYETPALTIRQLRAAALDAGFTAAEVDEGLAGLGDTKTVTYTLQVAGGSWTVFGTLDDKTPIIAWAGPYVVVDPATVVAGEPPCGPITYDYRIEGDRVAFVVLADDCVEDGVTAPTGELIAQVTIYQTAPFVRLSE